jgi:hypothetical protein
MKIKNSFNESEINAFSKAEKVGIAATINPEGLPHITLITSIQAVAQDKMTLGEFCKGESKMYIQKNPKIGFLIMTLSKELSRGKALWTNLKKEGPEYEMYNNQPMFRYNTYFGINTVHYLDLVETTNLEGLPMSKIIKGALLTGFAKGGSRSGVKEKILTHFAETLFNKLDSLKFISYIGKDGFPVIFPVIQSQASDSRTIVFAPSAFQEDIASIPDGSDVAVFCLSLTMEDVLIRGTYHAPRRIRGVKLAAVDIKWVYNSMPPNHRQIYPEVPLTAVENFI